MSTCAVFVGPTLHGFDVTSIAPDALVLPPAGRGDVYRAVRGGARVIGLVDGVFDQTRAVLHKELQWALCEGVRVVGAASMGALRAVELRTEGMEGIGTIFGWYREGRIEDDDEVAIAHAPASEGFAPLSDAMVDIRATVERGLDEGLLDASEAEAWLEQAKCMFYPERSFVALERALGHRATECAERSRCPWCRLAEIRVHLKQADGLCLLRSIAQAPIESTPPGVRRPFVRTDAWVTFERELDGTPVVPGGLGNALAGVPASLHEPLLRLAYHRILARLLARQAPPPDAVQAMSESFRRAQGLGDPVRTMTWLESRGLDRVAFTRWMSDEASLRATWAEVVERVERELAVVLGVMGSTSEAALRRAWALLDPSVGDDDDDVGT